MRSYEFEVTLTFGIFMTRKVSIDYDVGEYDECTLVSVWTLGQEEVGPGYFPICEDITEYLSEDGKAYVLDLIKQDWADRKQGLTMIVDHLLMTNEWDETWIAADKPGPLGKSKAQGVKELVESLRQRVKELEDELSPRVCCQDFANCQTACLPMGDHWRAKAAELEETLIDYKAELAALKAGQRSPNLPLGEPVAWALQHKNGLAFEWEGFIQPTYEKAKEMQRRHIGSPTIVKLYTSAPTIPEGWVMVPVEPTPEMMDAVGAHHGSNHKEHYQAMIAAAPKPEE